MKITSYNPFLFWQFSEVNSGFFYKSAAEREKLVAAERQFVDDRVKQVISLKHKVKFLQSDQADGP